jgi:anti-sigma regulatory factor (Ser/Thr protein kinase)
VVLTVRDKGHWVERPSGPLRYRGNGFPLMKAVMDSVELTHENGDGTAVTMSRRLAPEADGSDEGMALSGERPA